MFVRARRQLVVSLRDRAERAEAEQQLRVEQARQAERARIAREMHDVLAHRISLLSLHAGALEFRPDAPPEEVARAAGVIRASAHEALEDLREVIGVLRDVTRRRGARAPAAHARRPAGADRRVARGRACGSTSSPRSRRRRCRRRRPQRVPDRAGGADERPQARARRGRRRDARRRAGQRPARSRSATGCPSARWRRRRIPGAGTGWSASPNAPRWPAAGSSTAAPRRRLPAVGVVAVARR